MERFKLRTINWRQGLLWAALSPLFLGTIPIFAKLAYREGLDVLTVVAFRTGLAAGMLWLFMLISGRRFIRSSSVVVVGSLIAGGVNGIGSLFFYASLTRIDASLGQLINITYLIFVTILLRLAGQAISRLAVMRMILAIAAIYILTNGGMGEPDWIGIGLMLVAALAYALQLVMGQRIMYEVPAQTMTLYAMTGMATVVVLPWLIIQPEITLESSGIGAGWWAVILMGITTAASRLTLFLGVKHLGSLQTSLISVAEVVVTIVIAALFLGERFTLLQWLGALLLLATVLMTRYETTPPKFINWWRVVRRVSGKTGRFPPEPPSES